MDNLVYVLDVQVQNDGDVLVFGCDPTSKPVAIVVRGFEFTTYYELTDALSEDEVHATEKIARRLASKISSFEHVSRHRFNFYKCDVHGRRAPSFFLKVGTKDIASWRLVSGKKKITEDDFFADLLGDEAAIEFCGKKNDGVDRRSDGRACNAREGTSVSILAHQFLRTTGLRCCEWAQFESGTKTGIGENGRRTDHRFDEIRVEMGDVGLYTGPPIQPKLKIASWDIECLNTLCVGMDAATFPQTSKLFQIDNGIDKLIKMAPVPETVLDAFSFVSTGTSTYNRTGTSPSDYYRTYRLAPNISMPYIRFEFDSLTDLKKRYKGGDMESSPKCKFYWMYEDDPGSLRRLQIFPGESLVLRASNAKPLWVAIKKDKSACHFDLDCAKKQVMFYFREFDTPINKQTIDQMRWFFSDQSGMLDDMEEAKDGTIRRREGCDITVHFRAPDGNATVGLHEKFDWSKIGENWTLEIASRAGKVDFKETLRFNEIPSPSCPFNEIIAVSWNESVYTQGRCEDIDDLCIYQMCRPGFGGGGLPPLSDAGSAYRDIRKNNESDLLEQFFKTQEASHAIVALGYNTSGFDIPYVYRRACEKIAPNVLNDLYSRALGFRRFRTIEGTRKGKRESLGPSVRSTESAGMGQSESWTMPGFRFYVDLYTWFRQHFPPKTSDGDAVSLKLNSVSQFYLDNRKLDVCFKEVNRRWRDAFSGQFQRHVVDYCVQDSRLVTNLAICSAVSLIEYNLRLSSVMNVLPRLMPMNNVGQMARLEPYVQHAAYERGIIVNQALKENVMMASDSIEKQYQGGKVLHPIEGEHGRWIPELGEYDWAYSLYALDFKSLYPSVMRAFNICWHSMIQPGYVFADHDVCPGGLKIVWSYFLPLCSESPQRFVETECSVVSEKPGCIEVVVGKTPLIFKQRWAAGYCHRDHLTQKVIHKEWSTFPRYQRFDPHTDQFIEDGDSFIAVYCIVPATLTLLISEPTIPRLVSAFVQKTHDDQEGVLPERLTKMNDLRAEVRRNAKTLPPELQASAQAEQLAIKVCANAQYGMIAPAHMNPMIRMAAAVTFNSRKMLMRAHDRAIRDGFEVVYGDTDSIFVRMDADLRRRTVRDILARECGVPADAPLHSMDCYEDLFETPETKRSAFEAVKCGLFDFITEHAESQTKDFESPNELEFENVFLKSEFFEDTRKCYVALATEGPSKAPKMYYKGVTCRKSDCIELSREIQRLCYMAKCNPTGITEAYPDIDLDPDPFLTARRLIARIFMPLLEKTSCTDDEFYEWCGRHLVQRKVYKRESSYKNPEAMPHVMARRGVEAHCPTMACGVGDSQSFLVCKTSSQRACDGAFDPRMFAIHKMRAKIDTVYYIRAVWKGLKGDASTLKSGTVLKVGRMNENTFVNLKPFFDKLILKAVGIKSIADQLKKQGWMHNLFEITDRERARASVDFKKQRDCVVRKRKCDLE